MTALRALLRHVLFGIVLAYVMTVQALLAGPLLAAPLHAGLHELCLTGEAAPDGAPVHGGHDCPCLAPGAHQVSSAVPPVPAITLPMRVAVPFAYAAPVLPSGEGQGPESPAARGPPSILV